MHELRKQTYNIPFNRPKGVLGEIFFQVEERKHKNSNEGKHVLFGFKI